MESFRLPLPPTHGDILHTRTGSATIAVRRGLLALTTCFLLLATLVLVACGGSDDPASQGATEPPASAYTAEQRAAATGRVAEKYEELLASKAADPWQELKAYVLSQPEFVDAGTDRNSLWARFTDGRYFLYVDNWRRVAPAATEPPTESARLAPSLALAAATGAAAQELPDSDRALLLRMNDFEEFVPGEAVISRAEKALTSRGWKVSPDRALTVDGLKGRGALGILYLNSHAGMFGPGTAKRYSFITTTKSTDENERIYADDLADGSLIYARSRNDLLDFGDRRFPRYAVTSTFVRKHLTFSPHSLVVMMMCEGGSDESAEFRTALTARGAGTVIAWNGPANELGYRPIDVIFDRLTGQNAVEPKQPPNRAFNFDDVWRHLEQRHLVINPPSEPGGQPSFIKRFGGGFDLSNPVITTLQPTYPDRLYIHGDFGSEPGSVTIGGTPLPATWVEKGSIVVVDLPTGAGDPPGSHGDVVVTARGRKSNVRTLTSWRGQVTYLLEDLPDTVNGGAGVLRNQVTVNLHLRGDAHAIRTSIDGPLQDNNLNVVPASDTAATWSASGRRTFDGEFFESWSGSGALALKWPHNPLLSEFMLIARVNAVKRRLQLLPAFTQAPLVTKTDGDGAIKTPIWIPIDALGFDLGGPLTFLDNEPLPYGTNLPLDAGMNLPAAQQVIRRDNSERVTVKWTQMTATPPLRDDVGR